jgi:replication-associated recombination protein RarA
MICASEDVGNADPRALEVAVGRMSCGRTDRSAGKPDHPGPGMLPM